MTKIRCAALAAIVLITGVAAFAQQSAVTLDGKAITVKYAPAAVQDRKIFGTLHTDTDIVFKGVAVPAGNYSLYVLLAADKWQLIINKQTGPKAANYDPKLDVGRVSMVMAKAPAPVETSKIALTKVAAMAAKIEIAWENVVATTQFHLDRVAGDSEW
jgi:hypothetical protein